MSTDRTRNILVGIAMIPIAGLVLWLVTKMARTPQGDYRLLVIGGAMVFMAVVIAIASAIGKLRA